MYVRTQLECNAMVNELWFKIGHTHSNIDPTVAVWKMRQEQYRVLLENHKGSLLLLCQ